jgi:hypothetical protein
MDANRSRDSSASWAARAQAAPAGAGGVNGAADPDRALRVGVQTMMSFLW